MPITFAIRKLSFSSVPPGPSREAFREAAPWDEWGPGTRLKRPDHRGCGLYMNGVSAMQDAVKRPGPASDPTADRWSGSVQALEPARLVPVSVASRQRRRAVAAPEPKPSDEEGEAPMHNIIYLIGLIVVVLAILSFLGLR